VEKGSEVEENVKEFAMADGTTAERFEMMKDKDVFFTLLESNGKWDWKFEVPGIFCMEQTIEVGVPGKVTHPKTGEEMEFTVTVDKDGRLCSKVEKGSDTVSSMMELEGGDCIVTRTLQKQDGTSVTMKQKMVKVPV